MPRHPAGAPTGTFPRPNPAGTPTGGVSNPTGVATPASPAYAYRYVSPAALGAVAVGPPVATAVPAYGSAAVAGGPAGATRGNPRRIALVRPAGKTLPRLMLASAGTGGTAGVTAWPWIAGAAGVLLVLAAVPLARTGLARLRAR
jgi:hypothetical protein